MSQSYNKTFRFHSHEGNTKMYPVQFPETVRNFPSGPVNAKQKNGRIQMDYRAEYQLVDVVVHSHSTRIGCSIMIMIIRLGQSRPNGRLNNLLDKSGTITGKLSTKPVSSIKFVDQSIASKFKSFQILFTWW